MNFKPSRLLGAIIVVLLCCPAASSLADPKPPRNGELSLTKFYTRPIQSFDRIKFGGSIKGTNYSYPYAFPNTDIRTSNRLIFKLFMDGRLDEYVQIYGKMKLRTDLPQSTIRTRVIPQEAYLSVNLDDVNIRGGYQIFSWGVADFINPTDRLNPYDYSDIFDFEKEGIPALSIAFSRGMFTLEGVWNFIPDESELPYRDSRFVEPFMTEIDNPLFPIFGAPPADYDVTENNLAPSKKIQNSQFGVRIRATVGRFDLGLSYFNGYEKLPHPEVIVHRPDPTTKVIPVTINEVFFREHMIGFNIATGYEGLNLKTESALVIPYHTAHNIGAAGSLHYTYVVGYDYTFFDLFDKHSFSIDMEYIQEIDTVKPKTEEFGRLFLQSLLTRLEYKFSEYFRIRLLNGFNFNNHAYYLEPEIIWQPIDDLELRLGANILDGPSDTLFGLFDKQDRIYTSVKYFF